MINDPTIAAARVIVNELRDYVAWDADEIQHAADILDDGFDKAEELLAERDELLLAVPMRDITAEHILASFVVHLITSGYSETCPTCKNAARKVGL